MRAIRRGAAFLLWVFGVLFCVVPVLFACMALICVEAACEKWYEESSPNFTAWADDLTKWWFDFTHKLGGVK